jgi:hypothetical protein
MLTALGGLGLTMVSSAGEGLGAMLDVTGIGAVAGVPIQAVSTGGVVVGGTMLTGAMTSLMRHAMGDDHVEPIKTNDSGETSTPPEQTPPAGAQEGWSSRPANNGKGTVWQRPGADGNADQTRIMDPGADPRYPNGYVRFYNKYGQAVGLDGKPGSIPDSHIPRNPDGTYPLPEGW